MNERYKPKLEIKRKQKAHLVLKERQKKYMQGFVQAGLATLVLALPSKKMLAKRGDGVRQQNTTEWITWAFTPRSKIKVVWKISLSATTSVNLDKG